VYKIEYFLDAKSSARDTVPPAPFWVMGFSVLPADVIVCVPEVAANVHVPVVPVVKVIPDTRVNEPKNVVVAVPGAQVPVYPVKFKSFTTEALATVNPPLPFTLTFNASVSLWLMT
jgi:hypothetical protein